MDPETTRRLKAKLKKLLRDDPEMCYRAWRFGLPAQVDVSLPGRASQMMATGHAESTTAADVYPPHVGAPGPVIRRAGPHLVSPEQIMKAKRKRKKPDEDRGPGFPDVPLHPWASLARRFPGVFR